MQYRGQRFIFDAEVKLGSGGMADVYLGIHEDVPNMHVAIKIPRPDLPQAQRDLFLREAEAAQQISSRNVVRVVDWGDNPPFIAFEFVEGTTLGNELRLRQGEQSRWSEAELVDMFQQLAQAMLEINRQVIHRDLKPENVFVTNGNVLKIGDFGIAKYAGEVTRSKTFKGWGTLPYMAPETWRSESIDWRADQYSLGVVFFEMATLHLSFVGNEDELERQHLYVRPARINTLAEGRSERLATLVNKMLEKRASDRFASWEDILTELEVIERALPEQLQTEREDRLAKVAAQQIELVRSQELEKRRLEEEQTLKQKERNDLLSFWANELFGKIRSRVEQINRTLGQSAIQCSINGPSPRYGTWTCNATFLNARLEVTLNPVPLDGPDDVLLWGIERLISNGRLWIGNLYLASEPPPYGTWYQVDMKMSTTIHHGVRPEQEDRKGGRYEVFGSDRLVLGLNWQAIVNQREMRNWASLVNYRETPLAFDAVLEEWVQILVEDATINLPDGGSAGAL